MTIGIEIRVQTLCMTFCNLTEGGRSMSGNHEFDYHDLATSLDLSAPQWNPRLTRRGFMAAAAGAAATAWLAACGSQPTVTQTASLGTKLEGTVNLYNWQSYINPDDVKAFEQQLGQKVTQDFFVSNEDLLAKLQAGAKGYDVIVPTGYMVEIMIKQRLLYKLAKDHLPNFKNVDERFTNLAFDPGNQYSVPKDWGTTGFGYRTDLLPQMSSWADFWKYATTRASGKVTVLDGENEVIGSALKMLGYSYNSVDPNELNQAKEKLMQLKSHLLSITSTQYIDLMQKGQAIMALGWNGDFFSIQTKQPKVVYVVPVEGSEYWVDNWCITRTAPHPVAAHAFLNFFMDPKVAGKEISVTYYAQDISAAKPYIDPTILHNVAVYPPQTVIDKLEAQKALGDGQRLRDEIWTEFKAA
jgi:spermidine/putrescine transport system substrate-binding protein